MASAPGSYRQIPGVKDTDFQGDIQENYEGTVELEVDGRVPHIWFSNVPLEDTVRELNQDYDVSAVKAVHLDEELEVNTENREQLEDLGWFNGFGLELNGSTAYIEHPTHYGKGLGETGSSHQHVKHYLEGRVEADVSQPEADVKEAVELTADALDVIEEKEDERRRRREIWSGWAEEHDYHEKGRLRKWWMRKFRGPNDGNQYLNPTAVRYDLDGCGLTADQLFDTAEQL